MAIKVLLVDDEKLERVLLRKGFAWEENGFVVIGEVGSAREALEFIRRQRPDVVFTDVNMPEMDGLELSECILSQFPGCRIVIVTGYREFDYARKAVKLGVEDFLLKPINVQEIAETARRLRTCIMQENEQAQEVEQLRESVLHSRDIMLESFYQRLVEGRLTKEEALDKLHLYGYETLLTSTVCVALRLREREDSQEVLARQQQVLALVEQTIPVCTISFIHYLHSIVLFFGAVSLEETLALAAQLHTGVSKLLQESCAMGISSQTTGFSGITQAYREAQDAMGACVILGHEQCISYAQYLERMNQNTDARDIPWEKLLFAVQSGMQEQVEQILSEYVAMVGASRVADAEDLRLMAMHLLSKVAATLHRYGTDLPEVLGEDSLYLELRQITTLSEMEHALLHCVGFVMRYHERKRTEKNNKVAQEALQYLLDNLFDPQLSLKTVAAAVYTNESYLSRTFKKETGQSLMEYILKKRIEESVHLLNTTDLKVYEIAEKIGFRDHHYFSICFKKQMGVTVKQFRTCMHK